MRVLLIEDDSPTAKAIELMLKSEGYVCDSTDLGEDGLESRSLGHGDPSMVWTRHLASMDSFFPSE